MTVECSGMAISFFEPLLTTRYIDARLILVSLQSTPSECILSHSKMFTSIDDGQ